MAFSQFKVLHQVKCIHLFYICPVGCFELTEHLTPWMTGLSLHSPFFFFFFTCIFVSRIYFELYLLSTDLYLRASADRAPLFPGLKTEGLPARFDWRDKAVVAPVQNQHAVRFRQIDNTYTIGGNVSLLFSS